MSVLEVRDLCKVYPAFQLKNVSFSLEEGKITGFIGRNGAGKTTTLKSLLNLVHPTSGSIAFFGKTFQQAEAEIKQQIGFVSGGVDYYTKKKLKVITDVTRRFYTNWDAAAYQRYMQQFSLLESKTPSELSAGMKVKYALALALSHNAKLLILDEPTSGLDPVSRDELLEIFLTLCDQGITILFSTHITSDLDKCADNIIYIRNGKILAESSMKAFIDSYRLVEWQGDLPASCEALLVGIKRTKEGHSGLVPVEKAATLGYPSRMADLEEIMVHLEKEEA
ncbi:MAG: ABC transporter ATP-binding protein [Eubacteriales bacterium]|nr:ABC transporter ATP-binding protein [Eubacteriales bacterium]